MVRFALLLLSVGTAAAQLQDLYDFTAGNLDGWSNAATADLTWNALTTATQSQGTGPVSDHTSGSGEYLVVEASCGVASNTDGCSDRCPQGRTATLESPAFAEGAVESMSFWYHMYGQGPQATGEVCDSVADFMGETFVQAANATGFLKLVWYKRGDQGNAWRYTGPLYLPSDTTQVRITHRTGIHWASDAALDDVALFFADRTPSATLFDAPAELFNGENVPTLPPSATPADDGDDDDDDFPIEYIIIIVIVGAMLCCIAIGCYFQWSYIVYRCCRKRMEQVQTKDTVPELKVSSRDVHSVLSFEHDSRRPGIQRAGTSTSTDSKRRFHAAGMRENGYAGEMKISERPGGRRTQSGRPDLEGRSQSFQNRVAPPSFEGPFSPTGKMQGGGLPRPMQRFATGPSHRNPRATQELMAALDDARDPDRKLAILRRVAAAAAGEGRYPFATEELDALLKRFPSASHRMAVVDHLFAARAGVIHENDASRIDEVLRKHFLVDSERAKMLETIRGASLEGRSAEELDGYTLADVRGATSETKAGEQ